ncbi:helix-turn-helix domain-containing protein [Devosia sp.]|uniref:helix-turn-helix domain-containing protein n=1 Tax=Devosia sp. TaxID=1871048 RepID=UPI002FC8EF92
MPRKIYPPQKNAAPTTPFLSCEEAAEYLQVSVRTLDVWRCTRRYPIPYVKVGARVRYRKTDLDAWLESRTSHAAMG